MNIVVVVRFPTASPSLSSSHRASQAILGLWKMENAPCPVWGLFHPCCGSQCHQARSTYRQLKRTRWEVGTLFPIWSTLRSTYVLAAPPPWLWNHPNCLPPIVPLSIPNMLLAGAITAHVTWVALFRWRKYPWHRCWACSGAFLIAGVDLVMLRKRE